MHEERNRDAGPGRSRPGRPVMTAAAFTVPFLPPAVTAPPRRGGPPRRFRRQAAALTRRPPPPAPPPPAPPPPAPPPPAPPAPPRARWWRRVRGDTVITWAMAATVAVVAVDAAIVSYSHIYDLATGAPGSGTETGIQPRLLPLSIDGVIAEASLVLLYASRNRLPAPRLARCMLVLGILATAAANVTHGLPSALLSPVTHIVISALLSAWPAGAFIGSVEMAVGLVRAVNAAGPGGGDDDGGTEAGGRRWWQRRPPPARPARRRPASRPPAKRTARRRPAARPPASLSAKAAMADAVLAAEPGLTNAEAAIRAGVSERTIERARDRARKAAAP
jgi:hypothetical protein